jgi:predicted nucleic acid-binding protein
MIFFDASAVVKAYLTENGSGEVRATLLGLKGRLYLTSLVVLEVLGTFAKHRRSREVDRRGYRNARRAFLAELAALHVLAVENPVYGVANDLVDRHWRVAAGSMDALHIASALQLRALWPHELVIVASSDHAFLSLARAAGLPTFDPETESFSELQSRLG